MRQPSELMSKNYCGPSKLIPLSNIKNEDGFRFIGIDKDGGDHYCIVRKGDDGRYYMDSNTVVYSELCGWLPDTKTPNVEFSGTPAASSPEAPLERRVGGRRTTSADF